MPSSDAPSHNAPPLARVLPTARLDRFKAIDILRAVAILLVMGRHMPVCPIETSAVAHVISKIWCMGGWIGVDLFFVLSGFLVSRLLFREHEKFGTISLKNFLFRRGFKIYPLFWLLIGVTILVTFVSVGKIRPWDIMCELLFVQNYGGALWSHTWSLAVEEHFYILLVCLLWLLTRNRGENVFGRLPMICAVVCISCFLMRLTTGLVFPFSSKTHIFPSHLRLDSLFFGVLIAHWYSRNPMRFLQIGERYWKKAVVAGVLCLVPAFIYPIDAPLVSSVGIASFCLGAGLILFAMLSIKSPQGRVSDALAFIGKRSYSIYLWHYPVLKWLAPRVGIWLGTNNWFVFIAAYFVGSVVVGSVISRLVEVPVLKLRDRWFPSLLKQ